MADVVIGKPIQPQMLYLRHEGIEPIWYAVCRESGLRWRVRHGGDMRTGKLVNSWDYTLVPKDRLKPKLNRIMTDNDWREVYDEAMKLVDEVLRKNPQAVRRLRLYKPVIEKDPNW